MADHGTGFIALSEYREYPLAEMRARMAAFLDDVRRRRTVRDFSDRPVPRDLIETAIRSAGTAPSGANQQPWHFVAVADPAVKRRIRLAAEEEERAFYAGRAGDEWLDALAPLGTDADKPFLETAPWLIAIFAQRYSIDGAGARHKNYYVPESVGLASGLLITALHTAGLATLTHTPSPMNFLNDICGRPENEKPYILLVVGYPAPGCRVPDIRRKDLDEISSFL
ncbi:MAG: nitroreductase family protein [Hyphomicrobiales bacterium]|nr:nitroreductase family protein [Hyphomicrobiales bacterium]